jgi:hypothetical protein
MRCSSVACCSRSRHCERRVASDFGSSRVVAMRESRSKRPSVKRAMRVCASSAAQPTSVGCLQFLPSFAQPVAASLGEVDLQACTSEVVLRVVVERHRVEDFAATAPVVAAGSGGRSLARVRAASRRLRAISGRLAADSFGGRSRTVHERRERNGPNGPWTQLDADIQSSTR